MYKSCPNQILSETQNLMDLQHTSPKHFINQQESSLYEQK